MVNIDKDIIEKEEYRLKLYKEKMKEMENIERAYKRIIGAKKSILKGEIKDNIDLKYKEIKKEENIIEKSNKKIREFDERLEILEKDYY